MRILASFRAMNPADTAAGNIGVGVGKLRDCVFASGVTRPAPTGFATILGQIQVKSKQSPLTSCGS